MSVALNRGEAYLILVTIIAFVYSGEPPASLGTETFLDTPLVNQSLNAWLLNKGHAYPAFYSSLPLDLRERRFRHGQSRFIDSLVTSCHGRGRTKVFQTHFGIDQVIYKTTRRMNLVWIQLTDWNNFLSFGDD